MISSRYNYPGRSPPASSTALGTTPAEPVNGTDSSCSREAHACSSQRPSAMDPAWGGPRGGRRARGPRRRRSGQYRHYRRQHLRRRKAPRACSGPRPARTVLLDGPVLEWSELCRAHQRRARRGRGPGIQLRDRRGPVRVGGTDPPHRCARPGRPSHWPRGGQPERTRRLLHRRQRPERALRGGAARRHPASARRNRHRKRRDWHRPVGARGTEALRARRHAEHRKPPGSQVARGGHGRQRDRANGRVQRRAPTDRGRPRIAARHRCRHRQLQRPVR